MKVTGQLFGRDAIAEGYTHDSMGLLIDPNGIYDYQGIRYDGITFLCRVGVRPKVRKPIVRK